MHPEASQGTNGKILSAIRKLAGFYLPTAVRRNLTHALFRIVAGLSLERIICLFINELKVISKTFNQTWFLRPCATP
jgi:hypothetical protein